jgi:hypothetical protein
MLVAEDRFGAARKAIFVRAEKYWPPDSAKEKALYSMAFSLLCLIRE